MKKLHLLLSLGFIFIFSFSVSAQAPSAETLSGIELYQKGDYTGASESLQKVVAANKKDALAWLYLGGAAAQLNDAKQAKAAFKKVKGDVATNFPTETNGYKPLKIVSQNNPPYTEEARANSVQGTVKFAVEFKANGEIGLIFPYKTLPHGLTEQALNVTQQIKFEPATKDGKPISVLKIVEYGFNMY